MQSSVSKTRYFTNEGTYDKKILIDTGHSTTTSRREYIITHSLMEYKEQAIPIETLLESHIVLTQEVRLMTLEWKQRGALLIGLSDKPNEAVTPVPALAAEGWLPLHRVPTCAVGE